MRCPTCNYNQPYSQGMTCVNCRYNFVFNPKKDEFNDYKFKLLVDKMGQGGTIFYTADRLYMAYLTKSKSNTPKIVGGISSLVFIGLCYLLFDLGPDFGLWGFLLIFALVSLVLAIGSFSAIKKKMDPYDFKTLLAKWNRQHQMPNLLRQPGLFTPPSPVSERDIYDYGVEGIMVVDEKIYVDLLVRNDYHTQMKVVVISQDGYPSYLIKKIQQTINQSDGMKMYYLHDADTSIHKMKNQTRKRFTLPNTVEEIDLGISTKDAKKIKLFRRHRFKDEAKIGHIPPARLLPALSTALVSGLLLSETLTQDSSSLFSSDFG